jgi:hypothetical protein
VNQSAAAWGLRITAELRADNGVLRLGFSSYKTCESDSFESFAPEFATPQKDEAAGKNT